MNKNRKVDIDFDGITDLEVKAIDDGVKFVFSRNGSTVGEVGFSEEAAYTIVDDILMELKIGCRSKHMS